MGRPRIKDVAEYAGVSAKTVSNVLNDYEHVSERTRTAVREAIDALGYRVNIAGRQLRRGRTGVIALAVPELDIAYFAELAKHVMAEAERRGRTTLLLETGGRREKELAAVQGFDAQFTDGVVLSPLALRPRDLQDRDTRQPLVLLGECNLPGSADHVAIDNVAAAREATAHLLARGRRRVAVVGGDLRGGLNTGRLRTVGYAQALTEAGLAVAEELVLPVAGVPLGRRRRRRTRPDAAAAAPGRAALPQRPPGTRRGARAARGRLVGTGGRGRGRLRRHRGHEVQHPDDHLGRPRQAGHRTTGGGAAAGPDRGGERRGSRGGRDGGAPARRAGEFGRVGRARTRVLPETRRAGNRGRRTRLRTPARSLVIARSRRV